MNRTSLARQHDVEKSAIEFLCGATCYCITYSYATVYYSYNTVIAARVEGQCYLTSTKWSRTTSGHTSLVSRLLAHTSSLTERELLELLELVRTKRLHSM